MLTKKSEQNTDACIMNFFGGGFTKQKILCISAVNAVTSVDPLRAFSARSLISGKRFGDNFPALVKQKQDMRIS